MKTNHKNFVSILLIFLLSFFIFITGCGGGGGSDVSLPPTTGDTPTGDTSDTTPPQVTSTYPSNGTTGFPLNSAISATFSEAMNTSTINNTTFTLSGITGTVSYSGTTAYFTPSSNLSSNTTYTATIATGVRDLAGNQMKSSYSWSFETGTTSDTTAPTDPTGLTATAVSSSQINLSWTTSTDSGGSGLAGYKIERCGGAGCANFTQITTTTLTTYSDTGLTSSTSYSYRVLAYDNAGNNSGYSSTASTTTPGPPDTTAPTVLSSSISPSNGAPNVSVNTLITATFSETMDGTTFTSSTFTLTSGAGAVQGIVSYAGTTATFKPSGSLSYATTYTATITTGVKDSAGNAMASSYSWSFTTGVNVTYYVSPAGSDSNSGLAQSTPFATFAKAFSVMQGGDTLYVMDGVYNQQITGMPSGAAGNYTKIYALNDHKAEIDGQGTVPSVGWEGLLYISGKSYVDVRGLRIHNSSETNHVCAIENSSNINIKVTACWQAGTYQHDTPVNISGGSSNILLEDVWAFGRGRYSVLVFLSNNITLRRVVTRWDSGAYAGQPNAGVSIYNSSNNIIENNITLDHNFQFIQPDHNGFYLPANAAHSDNNFFYGNIALNLPNEISGTQYGANGFYLDPASSQGAINNTFINNVAFNALNGIVLGGVTTSGTLLQNNTFGNNYAYGIYNGGSVLGTVAKNNLEYQNSGVGINNTGDMTVTFNGAFGNNGGGNQYNGVSSSCTGCSTANPGLLFPTRIESTSPYKGTGESGADIGANVIYQYQNGLLTAANLWPWPYENWIKEDMCTSVGETKGFCSKVSLTEYIWTYLGNPNPY